MSDNLICFALMIVFLVPFIVSNKPYNKDNYFYKKPQYFIFMGKCSIRCDEIHLRYIS